MAIRACRNFVVVEEGDRVQISPELSEWHNPANSPVLKLVVILNVCLLPVPALDNFRQRISKSSADRMSLFR